MNKVKYLIGITLIVILSSWVYFNGSIFQRLTTQAILASTLISFFIVITNSLILLKSIKLFNGNLSTTKAIFLTSSSTFANSLGGVPAGSIAKYIFLYKATNLNKRELLSGQIYFTLLNICSLIFLALIAINYKFSLLFLGFIITTFWLLSFIDSPYLAPLFQINNILSSLAYSLTTCLLMVTCYSVVSLSITDEFLIHKTIPIVCLGLVLGFGSGAPSLGGVQEILMGIASKTLSDNLIYGIELSLAIRFASLLSTLPFVLISMKLYK